LLYLPGVEVNLDHQGVSPVHRVMGREFGGRSPFKKQSVSLKSETVQVASKSPEEPPGCLQDLLKSRLWGLHVVLGQVQNFTLKNKF
jgi:hypothetical protein